MECLWCCQDTWAHGRCSCMQGLWHVDAGVVTTLLPWLNQGSAPLVQPQWGALLRRQVADTHQILEYFCWWETWKTESQLLIPGMRNPKPREMKGLGQDHATHSRLTAFLCQVLFLEDVPPPFLNILKSFHGPVMPKRSGANVHLKYPDSATLQLLLGCYSSWKEIK